VPVFAVLLGALLLKETLGWSLLVGAALVVLGVYLAHTAAPATPERPSEDSPGLT